MSFDCSEVEKEPFKYCNALECGQGEPHAANEKMRKQARRNLNGFICVSIPFCALKELKIQSQSTSVLTALFLTSGLFAFECVEVQHKRGRVLITLPFKISFEGIQESPHAHSH